MSGKVAIHGSYFANNFGDTLLIKLFCDKAAEYIGRDNVYLATHGCSYEQEFIGYPVVRENEKEQVDNLIFCGGGYFGEPPGSAIAHMKWAMRNYFRHLSWVGEYKSADKHFIGVGVGPLSNFIFRKKLGRLINSAQTLMVRDLESKEYCEKYFKSSPDIEVCVDYALSLGRLDQKKNGIGIHLPKLSESEIKIILEGIKLVDSNSKIYVIFDNASNYNHEQLALYRAAFDSLNLSDRLIFLPYKNCEDLIAVLSSLELVITSKLHVGIVSITQYTSVISVPIHDKTQRLYKQLSVGDFCKSRDQISASLIAKLISNSDLFQPDREKIYLGTEAINKKIRKILLRN